MANNKERGAIGAIIVCVLAILIAFFAGKYSKHPADEQQTAAEKRASKDTAVAIDDADKAVEAAEKAAASARKAADSTRETAKSAENSAGDAAESAKAAQEFVNKVNK